MIKLEIKIETEKEKTYLDTKISNHNPSKMEQIILNFILSYISRLTCSEDKLKKRGKIKNEKRNNNKKWKWKCK